MTLPFNTTPSDGQTQGRFKDFEDHLTPPVARCYLLTSVMSLLTCYCTIWMVCCLPVWVDHTTLPIIFQITKQTGVSLNYCPDQNIRSLMSNHQSSRPIEYPIRYYDLALKKCSRHRSWNESWSIHGLWPEFDEHHWPQFCQQVPFNMSQLSPVIRQDMKHYWFTCFPHHHSDESFWQHEWEKHGTCTPFNQTTYFQQGLRLYNEILSLGRWLNVSDPFYNWCGTPQKSGYRDTTNCQIRLNF